MDEEPIRNDAMGKDAGQSNSESTALIEYRVPAAPAPVPTFFTSDPPVLEATRIEAPRAGDGEPRAGGESIIPAASTIDEQPVIDAVVMSESSSGAPEVTVSAPPISPGTEPPVAPEPPSTIHTTPAAAPRTGRFALLAGAVALAASIGAVAGSLGYAEIQRHLFGAAVAPHAEAPEDIRVLKDAVAQLRTNIKALADNVVAMRASITASNSTVNGQLSKINEALDRAERHPVAAPPAGPAANAEVTGTVPSQTAGEPKPAAKPPIVDGWVIRKVYDGAALIEGRYGIVEVEPGMNLPGLGRIQDIKRQDGHWVVVTPKGLILPVR
jgi:hypothetical protein